MYQEALEASAKYNRELDRDRKSRQPFFESQTGVAQTQNKILNLSPYQRTYLSQSQNPNGLVISYPLKRWYKHKRFLNETNDTNQLFQQTHNVYLQHKFNIGSDHSNENSNSMDTFNSSGYHHSIHPHIQHSFPHVGSNYSIHSMVKSASMPSSSHHQPTHTHQPQASQFHQQHSVGAKTNPSVNHEEENEWSSYYHDDGLDHFEENNDSDGSDYEEKRNKRKRVRFGSSIYL